MTKPTKQQLLQAMADESYQNPQVLLSSPVTVRGLLAVLEWAGLIRDELDDEQPPRVTRPIDPMAYVVQTKAGLDLIAKVMDGPTHRYIEPLKDGGYPSVFVWVRDAIDKLRRGEPVEEPSKSGTCHACNPGFAGGGDKHTCGKES